MARKYGKHYKGWKINMNKYMEKAINKAKEGFINQKGGPFGAVIVDKNGKIISCECNTVLATNDPTAHSEINAIRVACKKLSTFNLKDCSIYITAEPCPMCLGAIMWANIEKVYYGCSKNDTANIGFKDDKIYDFINNKNNIINLEQINRKECKILFNEYSNTKHNLY